MNFIIGIILFLLLLLIIYNFTKISINDQPFNTCNNSNSQSKLNTQTQYNIKHNITNTKTLPYNYNQFFIK